MAVRSLALWASCLLSKGRFKNNFKKNKSTETASQTFIEKVQEAMDK
jgi:hypothetical protein